MATFGTRVPTKGAATSCGGVEAQVHVQAGVAGRAGGGVFGVGTGRVVALAGDAPADLVPLLMQVAQRAR